VKMDISLGSVYLKTHSCKRIHRGWFVSYNNAHSS